MLFSETYCAERTKWGFRFISIIPLSELEDENGGFIVNGEVKIVVELEIFVLVKQTLNNTKLNDKGDLVDVNGFQVLPSQVSCVQTQETVLFTSLLKKSFIS